MQEKKLKIDEFSNSSQNDKIRKRGNILETFQKNQMWWRKANKILHEIFTANLNTQQSASSEELSFTMNA